MKPFPKKKPALLFRAIKRAVRFFYPKIEVVGAENLPEGEAIIVGNHSQLHGPITTELYFPGYRYTWCAGQMMRTKEVPAYAYRDFWSQKPKIVRPFFKALSYIIAPLASFIFNNADAISVDHDSRIVSTFKATVKLLDDGARVIIFPEHYTPRNNIVYDFQDSFIDVAKLYYKKSGKDLQFVPLYIAPRLKKMFIGKPITFDHTAPIDQERKRIAEYLMDEITAMARALPEHKVVPYANLPKKRHLKNTDTDKTPQ